MSQNFPLNEQDLQLLNGVLESCPLYAQLAEKCIKCNLPAEDMGNKISSQQQLASNLKSQFFPDHP